MPVHKVETCADEITRELRRLPRLAQTAAPITSNPERLGGTPVIGLSRVPMTALIDYVIEGQTFDDFLDAFPAVERAAALAALERIKEALEEGWLATTVDY